jgi:hypothetical protein
MRPLTSVETPIAGVVNGETLFHERSRRGWEGLESVGWQKVFFAAFGGQYGQLCTRRISALRLCFGNVDVQISFRWEICEEEPSPEVWRALRGARELWIEQVRPAAALPRVNTQIAIVACPHLSFPLGKTSISESQRITANKGTPTTPSFAGDCRFVPQQQPQIKTLQYHHYRDRKLSNSHRKLYPCISTYETSA